MPDPSTSPRAPTFGMPLIRERLSGRLPRRALVDTALSAAPPEPALARPKRAAVATILRDIGAGPEVFFIRRAEHPLDPWSGHMAFPGGREEPHDGDLLETALRETREEVMLDLGQNAQLLGRLDELPVTARGRRTGLTVAPFVFELTHEVPVAYNYEVAEVLWAPLEPMFRGARATTFHYDIHGERLALPAHDIDGRIVWGLTHRMLEGLFALLR